MIPANSLGWILIRDFWADGCVNSILTLVPPPPSGSKLPSKTVAYFMALQGNPKSEDSAQFIIHLRSRLISIRESGFDGTYFVAWGYAPFICCLSLSRISRRLQMIPQKKNVWSNIYRNSYPSPATASCMQLQRSFLFFLRLRRSYSFLLFLLATRKIRWAR